MSEKKILKDEPLIDDSLSLNNSWSRKNSVRKEDELHKLRLSLFELKDEGFELLEIDSIIETSANNIYSSNDYLTEALEKIMNLSEEINSTYKIRLKIEDLGDKEAVAVQKKAQSYVEEITEILAQCNVIFNQEERNMALISGEVDAYLGKHGKKAALRKHLNFDITKKSKYK